MENNIWPIFVAALIPMVIGMIWYNPKVFGKAWMEETGMTEEKAKEGNFVAIMALAYLFSCMFAFVLQGMCIHQTGIAQLFAMQEGFGEAGTEATKNFEQVMAMVGNRHLSFGHGALHGLIGGLGTALPILAVNSMFELKSWRYIWINVGYWVVSAILMGGVLCQFGVTITAGQ